MSHVVALTVERVARLQNTKDGNPRWRLDFDHGHVMDTLPDAQIGHLVSEAYIGRTFVVTYIDSRTSRRTITAMEEVIA